VERAGYLYRKLLLLQSVVPASEDDDAAAVLTDAGRDGRALRAAVREVLDDLIAYVRPLTDVPHPISEWRPGDGSDDERWRALTDIERRDVLSLASAYESLIAWCEGQEGRCAELVDQSDVPRRIRRLRPGTSETSDYLEAERARIARFRRDMAFLERRRIAESA
jgi:hypothetical protein